MTVCYAIQAELRDVVDNLTVETEQLQSERGQQQRMAASITDQMTIEAQVIMILANKQVCFNILCRWDEQILISDPVYQTDIHVYTVDLVIFACLEFREFVI